MSRIQHLPHVILRQLPRPFRANILLVVAAFSRWLNDGGPQLGAGIAFYTMFALAPLLIIAIAVAGAVFGVEAARGQIVGEIKGLIGEVPAKSVEALIESAWRHPDGLRASIIGGLTLLAGATGVFTELRRALNAIAHVQPRPSVLSTFVRARLTGLALVLGFGFLAIASLLLSAGMHAFSGILFRGPWSSLLIILDLVVSVLVLTTAFAALLRWLPDKAPSWSAVWLGAVSCSVLFSSGKYLISLYLAHITTASSYGASGSFVVIMLWVYYSAQLLLFGGALTAIWDEHRQTRRPGTRLAADKSH